MSHATDIAQIVIAAFTAVGVIVSILFARSTLLETRRDREARQAPFLAFQPGGWELTLERFLRQSDQTEFYRLKWRSPGEPQHFGRLVNLGSGPALAARVQWIIDVYEPTGAKGGDPPALEDLSDTLPLLPRQLRPGEEAQLTRLPFFIAEDTAHLIQRASGRLVIKCHDVAGKHCEYVHTFMLWTAYHRSPPMLHITFQDLIPPELEGGNPAALTPGP
jgi:hypothetical protein